MVTNIESETSNKIANTSDNDSDTALIQEPPAGTRWRNIITVGILCFINLINYMDRFTLAGILSDVQVHFEIGDDKAGLLQTAFVLSYMIFAPIFGYLGDRQPRTRIMAAGIFLWSLTTFIGSFMNNFGWFIFFRALVGIGEASYSTIAPTIISDLFVKDVRSKMLALFYFAIPVGSGLGYIVGSETAKALGSWRWGLRVTPVLGAIAVILMLVFLKEPERGQAEGGSHVSSGSYKDDLRTLVKNPSFMLSTAGFTCVAFVAGALAWWGPRFIFLGLKLQPNAKSVITFEDVSYKFGLVAMASGLIGVPLGSAIAQRLRPKYPDCDPLICAFALIISAPLVFMVLTTASGHAKWCYTFVFFAEVFLNLTWSLVADILLYVVIPTRRSTAEAFQILISHAFGDAGSPYLVGVISEALKISLLPAGQGPYIPNSMDNSTVMVSPYEEDKIKFKSLQYALYLTSFVEVLGGIFFLLTAIYIVRDKLRVEKEVAENSAVQPTHRYAEEVQSSTRIT